MVEKFAKCTVKFDWNTVLGFGCVVTDDANPPTISFNTHKYTLGMVERFLKGENKPNMTAPSRQSIMDLPAIELPPLGSPEDIAMKGMQDDCRALTGGLGHLARGRIDIVYEHNAGAQGMHRPTYEYFEAMKNALRYSWAHVDEAHVHSIQKCMEVSPSREPIRPYDEDVEYGLYGIKDANYAKPGDAVYNSKSTGAYAVMLGAAAVDWKSWRFHSVVTDTTSAESQAGSRLSARMVYFRAICQFTGIAQGHKPSPTFTDNDGLWYQAKDAADAVKMAFVIRHVRFIQQAQEMKLTRYFQIDGLLNPVDPLTKWKDTLSKKRDFLFLMGKPHLARKVWRESKAFQAFKPKKIVPVSPLEHD